MAEHYDLVVLGAGPGGYVAAIHAAQQGMKVAVVEKEKLGGVCLHKGCIPTKTLLKSASLYAQMKSSHEYGVYAEQLILDWEKIQQRKVTVVERLQQGIEQLFSHHQIDCFQGTGRILGPSIFSPLSGTISVTSEEREPVILIPQQVIIATGSRPREWDELPFDGDMILSSDQILELTELPRSILIVGGGVIGVEWASLLQDFGVQVTIVETMERILPQEDRLISREMERILRQRGVQIYTNAKILADRIEREANRIYVPISTGNQEYVVEVERVLISIGRQANVEGIGLKNTAIQYSQGYIEVNDFMQTKEKHIYAIGDVIGGYQLAHVASREGVIAVEHMAGKVVSPLATELIPRCTYSRPEVASIGLTEDDAMEQGYQIQHAIVPMKQIAKAVVSGETDGWVKLVVNRENEDILGIHMIGSQVTELIATAGLAQVFDAASWEMGQAIYAHPTLAEVFQEVSGAINYKG
ncbi:dihydrolipoamide dehydrogenase [Seinonella peptonophila]|uniref:Dihydrolipoyl dehydrogenase n=1 Tax=Seinonella peptonophila TaxID=112248 RepID=A0A1M4TL55_9BACL|nr:dihydrolipoyl dehydrogenase [Seinonella peptonophila]SHE45190.1 dihydrolipoamide dehydrogenase [Seinonella peptonophila]